MYGSIFVSHDELFIHAKGQQKIMGEGFITLHAPPLFLVY